MNERPFQVKKEFAGELEVIGKSGHTFYIRTETKPSFWDDLISEQFSLMFIGKKNTPAKKNCAAIPLARNYFMRIKLAEQFAGF